jgi:hypothetical protein
VAQASIPIRQGRNLPRTSSAASQLLLQDDGTIGINAAHLKDGLGRI